LITPTQAAITVGLNPLTAILLGAWLLSEPVTANVWVGFVMIVAAIVLANMKTPAGFGSKRIPSP
jgi:drug/metabolite transporter (DMT)-like permease